LLPLI
jgi:Site-specific recombinases, DNA invertase Pin homologs